MNLMAKTIGWGERAPLPDAMSRAGVGWLVARSDRRLQRAPAAEEAAFVTGMSGFPIAVATDLANAQHYELPPELFVAMLGPRLKYSCCLFERDDASLEQAEVAALDATIAHAALADGQTIMEWGCGWGSLTLAMAERFPNARILAVSNSRPQQAFVRARAAERGLSNVAVERADMNDFATAERFDRLVSVEMFEHMSNWTALLARARAVLKPDGRLFLHVFTHRSRSYRFDPADSSDWIAQHFFTGGVMPAHDLPHRFGDLFAVEREWRWSGRHYRLTAEAWLRNFDSARPEVDRILDATYGREAALWRRRWRLFLLATAGLFGHANGEVWGVGHYLLAPNFSSSRA